MHYTTVLAEADRLRLVTPVLRAVLGRLRELEADPGTMSERRLDEFERFAVSLVRRRANGGCVRSGRPATLIAVKRGRRRARDRESGTLSTRVRRIWEVVTTTLALLTAIYLVLNTIEPTRMVLERHVLKLNVEALTAIVAIMLEVAIVAVYQLGCQVRAMRAELGPRKDTQIVDDVGGVVAAVKRLSRTGRRSERTPAGERPVAEFWHPQGFLARKLAKRSTPRWLRRWQRHFCWRALA